MNGSGHRLSSLEVIQQRSLAVGVIAFALCIIVGYFNRQQFFPSYLMAYVFWLGIPLGGFGLLMIHHLVGGTWGFVIQRPLESVIRTFPVMVLLFLPLFFGLSDLYSWARPEAVAHDLVLQGKSVYLNVPFFVARVVLYFVIWIVVSHFLMKWSQAQERSADGTLIQRLKNLSGPGLVLYGLTVTFSGIDWVMSLEPQWYSTIYGMIFMVSHGLVALGFVIAVVVYLSREQPLSRVTPSWVFQDLGNVLLALVMLWAYTSFSQFLLVWVENLNKEVPWYLHRMAAGWGGIAVALIVLEFALPFLLLLSRTVKYKGTTLCGVALLLVLMHLIETFWFIVPAFHPSGLVVHWSDILAIIGIGGLWFAAFLRELKRFSLLPLNDPRFIALLEEHGLAKNG